jgi:antitoxin component HigA of HigAB toxin-antitoxin module
MNIRPIRTEEDLTWALAEVEPYFLNEPQKGSEDAARFEILSDLIRAYEALHWNLAQSEQEAGKPVVYRGVTYSDQASLRSAVRTEHIARVLKRKGGLMTSSGRLISRSAGSARRGRRAAKAG